MATTRKRITMHDKKLKSDICNYIRLQHRKPYKWLQEHIKSKFNVEINGSTIRTWKRNIGCLTDRKSCRQDWISYIRQNYLKFSDKELAERLINKFQRPIVASTIKKIRHKYHFYKPVPKPYRTVKEVRKCLNCGNDIKITWRNPNQKYCCRECAFTHRMKINHQRNMTVASPDKVKSFFQEYLHFSKKVLYDNKMSLNSLEREEVYTDYISQIPSIIYWLKTNNYTHRQHIKGYIAKTMRNCIFRKMRKKIEYEKNCYLRKRI